MQNAALYEVTHRQKQERNGPYKPRKWHCPPTLSPFHLLMSNNFLEVCPPPQIIACDKCRDRSDPPPLPSSLTDTGTAKGTSFPLSIIRSSGPEKPLEIVQGDPFFRNSGSFERRGNLVLLSRKLFDAPHENAELQKFTMRDRAASMTSSPESDTTSRRRTHHPTRRRSRRGSLGDEWMCARVCTCTCVFSSTSRIEAEGKGGSR